MQKTTAQSPIVKAVAKPFLDDISSELQDRLQDRILSFINFNIDETTALLSQGYKNEMVYEGLHFSSEVRRWLNLWNSKSY